MPVVRRSSARTSRASSTAISSPTTSSSPSAGTIKVLDFGIAKLFASREPSAPRRMPTRSSSRRLEHGLTRTARSSARCRTCRPSSGAPTTVDHRSDLWAVGIMLYEMLAGQHPLASARRQSQLLVGRRELDEPMPSIADAAPGLPARARPDRRPLPAQEEGSSATRAARAARRCSSRSCPGRRALQLSDDESPYAGCRVPGERRGPVLRPLAARSRRWSRGSATGR